MTQFSAEVALGPFDFVLANPPFNIDDVPAVVAFVAHALAHLKPGGRASILVPSGFLSGRGDGRKLRRELVEQGQIEALVKLPPGLFRPHANVVVWILMLRKTGIAGAAVRVIDGRPLIQNGACRKCEYLGPRDDPRRDANFRYVSAVDPQGQPQWEQCPAWELSEAELSGNGWNLTQWPTDRRKLEWLQAALGKALAARGEIGTLDRCADVFGGTSIPSTDLFVDPQPGAAAYVRIQDMDAGIVAPGEKWIPAERLQRIAASRRLVAGDVLLSKSGTIGKAALVDARMEGAVACNGIHVIRVIRATPISLDPAFLLAYLQSNDCNAWLNSYSNGAVIQGLRLGVLNKLVLPLPPIAVQGAALEHCKQTGADVLVSLTRIMDSR